MPKKPKVLFGESATSPATEFMPGRVPTTPLGQPNIQPIVHRGQPKVLAGGVPLKRMACSIEQLAQSAQPAAYSAAVLRQALRRVRSVNLDDAHFQDVTTLGVDLQAKHGALIECELALAQHPSVQEGQRLLTTIVKILARLDPDHLFAPEATGWLAALRQKMGAGASPQILFQRNHAQLLACVDEALRHEQALAEATDALASLKPNYATLQDGLASALLAANYIVAHVRTEPVQAHYVAQIEALEIRITSLSATRVSLETAWLAHQFLEQNLRALKHAMQGVRHEDLPAFKVACLTALTVAKPSADTMQALRRLYTRMVHQLKGNTP